MGNIKSRVAIMILKASVVRFLQLRPSSVNRDLYERWREFVVEKSDWIFESLTTKTILYDF